MSLPETSLLHRCQHLLELIYQLMLAMPSIFKNFKCSRSLKIKKNMHCCYVHFARRTAHYFTASSFRAHRKLDVVKLCVVLTFLMLRRVRTTNEIVRP